MLLVGNDWLNRVKGMNTASIYQCGHTRILPILEHLADVMAEPIRGPGPFAPKKPKLCPGCGAVCGILYVRHVPPTYLLITGRDTYL